MFQKEWFEGLQALEADTITKLKKSLKGLEKEVFSIFVFFFFLVLFGKNYMRVVP